MWASISSAQFRTFSAKFCSLTVNFIDSVFQKRAVLNGFGKAIHRININWHTLRTILGFPLGFSFGYFAVFSVASHLMLFLSFLFPLSVSLYLSLLSPASLLQTLINREQFQTKAHFSKHTRACICVFVFVTENNLDNWHRLNWLTKNRIHLHAVCLAQEDTWSIP